MFAAGAGHRLVGGRSSCDTPASGRSDGWTDGREGSRAECGMDTAGQLKGRLGCWPGTHRPPSGWACRQPEPRHPAWVLGITGGCGRGSAGLNLGPRQVPSGSRHCQACMGFSCGSSGPGAEPGGSTEEGWEEPGLGFGARLPRSWPRRCRRKAPAPEAAGSPPCVPSVSGLVPAVPAPPALLFGGLPQRGWRRRGACEFVCMTDVGEGGRGREKHQQRQNHRSLPPVPLLPPVGIKPTAQTCALTGSEL